jgi:hypothetical protein
MNNRGLGNFEAFLVFAGIAAVLALITLACHFLVRWVANPIYN